MNDKYRLFVDIPFVTGASQEECIRVAKQLIQSMKSGIESGSYEGICDLASTDLKLNFRLGNDADRNKSNYLNINENGHVSTKKSTLEFVELE